MTPEEAYRQKVITGYTKRPRLLLSRLVCRLFWRVDDDDYLFHVKEFVNDTTDIVGKENIEEVCSKIADLIMRNRKDARSSSKND